MIIGVDIGYGFTKIVGDNFHFSFKTAVEPYIRTDKIFESPKVIKVNDKSFLVGDDTTSAWRVPKDFVGTDLYYAIVGKSLFESSQKTTEKIDCIALGLPPSMYNERKINIFKENIQKMTIKNNETTIQPPQNVIFIPQGVGAYVDFIYNKPEYANKNIVVIDVGYYTLDMAIFREGKFIIQASKSYPSGIEILFERIMEEFTNRYGDFANIYIAEHLLKHGHFVYFGKHYVLDAQNILKNFYLNEIILRMKEYATFIKNKNFGIVNIDAFVFAGGGAVYLSEIIKDGIVVSEPHFANARGYKIYASEKTKL